MRRKIFYLILLFFFLQVIHQELNSESIQSKKNQEALEHEVTVTLKLVQVYVTDKKGNPVTDLEKSDFEVSEDGNAKEITEFEKHILTLPPIKEESQKELFEKAPPPEKMSRKFFLFFDFAFNNAPGIQKSKEAALHFMDTQVQPTDKVGVLSYSMTKGLKLHEYLSLDHQKVKEVLEGLGVKNVLGRVEEVEEKYFREQSGIQSVDASKQAQSFSNAFRAQQPGMPKESRFTKRFNEAEMLEYKYHTTTFSIRIRELAKALRYIPGHKHIVLFSSGVASSIMYGIGTPFGSMKAGSLGDTETRENYENMIKELSSSNSQVYSLNTEEQRSRIHKDEEMLGGRSLQKLSKSTGGKYFNKVDDYEDIMDEIQSLTSSYYVLGYYIGEKWDGKYHGIKVKVKRKGYKVHAQGGYYNPKLFSKYTPLEKRIHLVDLALTEKPYFQTPLHFPLLSLPCSVSGKSNLFMSSKIQVDKLQEISGRRVEVVSLIFDEKENVVDLQRRVIDFTKIPHENIYYYTLSSLSSGVYKCRVVIRNLETGRGAKGSSSVLIPEILDTGIKLWPPLLIKPEINPLHLNSPTQIYPFDMAKYSPVVEKLPAGTLKLLLLAPCSIINVPQTQMNISAHLIQQATGKEVPLELTIIDKSARQELLVLMIQLLTEELKPGKYSLYLFAKDLNSKLGSRVNTSFIVE